MTQRPTKQEMAALVEELRNIAPKRPLTYGESLAVARIQAARLRSWAHANEPRIELKWLLDQRFIPVNFVPSYTLNRESGLTTDQVSGRLEIYINDSEPPVRQRFSLLHEVKHVLDFDDAAWLHRQLGRGNEKIKAGQIEAIANEFAADVLMPVPLVKREWFAWGDLATVAAIFNVSVEAMARRLEKLGIIGDPRPTPRAYFRTIASTQIEDDSLALVAA
jgi:hypothetical protein